MMALKQQKCVECGKIYIARQRNYRPTCSIECGLKRHRYVVLKMAQSAKKG